MQKIPAATTLEYLVADIFFRTLQLQDRFFALEKHENFKFDCQN